LIFSGPERTGTGKKIIFPHAIKPIIVTLFQFVPVVIEVIKPKHKGLVIVCPKIMPVLKYEEVFVDLGNLAG
jgi:hypothetical protein